MGNNREGQGEVFRWHNDLSIVMHERVLFLLLIRKAGVGKLLME